MIFWISAQYPLEIFLSAALIPAAFILIFGTNLNNIILAFMSFILLSWSAFKIKKERDNHLKIYLRPLLQQGIFLILISIFIILAFIFYQSPRNELKISLPTEYLSYLEPLIQKYVPGYQPDLTFENFFLTYQLSQIDQKQQQTFLTNLIKSPDFLQFLKSKNINVESLNQDSLNKLFLDKEFFPILKKVALKVLPELKKDQTDFLKKYNVSEQTVNQKWQDFLTNNLNSWIEMLPLQWKNYLKIGLAAFFFLSLWALTPVFSRIILFLSWLIFKLLLIIKIIEIQKETREKEIVLMK